MTRKITWIDRRWDEALELFTFGLRSVNDEEMIEMLSATTKIVAERMADFNWRHHVTV